MVRKIVTIFVTCIAIIAGTIWYNAYLPISSKINGPSSKFLPFIIESAQLISTAGYKLGLGGSSAENFRALLSWADMMTFGKGQWKEGLQIEDTTIAGVPVKIFRPITQVDTLPALIHFHGGGLVIGSPNFKTFMAQCALLAKGTKSVVISVDYRLAPEHIFPTQFNDGFAVVSALMGDPIKYQVDGKRVALIGDSAGGLQSATISLELAKQTTPVNKLAAQVLVYPWMQNIDMKCLPSYKMYSEGFGLSARSMAFYASAVTMGNGDMMPEYLSGNVSKYFMQTPYWKYIADVATCKIPSEKLVVNLPSSFVDKVTDRRLSPLLAEDLSGSPPTFVAIAEYDVLASEGILFAKRLKEAGVPVVQKQYRTYHTFLQNIEIPFGNDTLARIAMNDIVNFLNSVFNNENDI